MTDSIGYKWLTGTYLNFEGLENIGYIDALDDQLYLTSANPINNPRWCVRDNLPGTPDYCPMVMRTELIRLAEDFDFKSHLDKLEVEFGVDILIRSAVWLTVILVLNKLPKMASIII